MQADSNPLTWRRLSKDVSIDNSTHYEQAKFGTVYRGFQFFRNHIISIKILPKVHTSDDYIKNLETVGKLNNQYIMGYYGYVDDGENYYFCLEHCPYGSLDKAIQKKLTQKECLRFYRQIVEALECMHRCGQTHKDLKPENILIGPYQDLKVCNFGLNDDEYSGIWETGKYGTAIYAAPEVLLLQDSYEEQCTEKANVWSAGLICYEMLTGHHLFKQVQSYDELKKEWLHIQRGNKRFMLNQIYHPLWNSFFNCMMAFRPQMRPSFKELLKQLQLIYPRLHSDLSHHNVTLSPYLRSLSIYIDFTITKYNILLDLCETFTSKDIRLRNQFKYLIMFCCIMRYRAFFRTFSQKIKNKDIKIRQEAVFPKEVWQDSYCELILMEGVTIMKQKEGFYARQLTEVIIPKILHVYYERQQSHIILNETTQILQLVKRAEKEPEVLEEESQYQDALHSVLPVIEKIHGKVTEYYNRQQLEIYSLILIVMLLSDQYPQELFSETNVLADLTNQVESLTPQALVENVKKLSDLIF